MKRHESRKSRWLPRASEDNRSGHESDINNKKKKKKKTKKCRERLRGVLEVFAMRIEYV
jgi:hypothetical protein